MTTRPRFRVRAVIGQVVAIKAIILQSFSTIFTGAAGVDHTDDTHTVIETESEF